MNVYVISLTLKTSAKNMRSLHYIRKYFKNNEYFDSVFSCYRRIYRQTIKCAKRLYYSNRITSADNKQREAWRCVNELRGTSKKLRVDSELSAGDMNNFFCSIAVSLSKHFSNNPCFEQFLRSISIKESFFLSPTDTVDAKRTNF